MTDVESGICDHDPFMSLGLQRVDRVSLELCKEIDTLLVIFFTKEPTSKNVNDNGDICATYSVPVSSNFYDMPPEKSCAVLVFTFVVNSFKNSMFIPQSFECHLKTTRRKLELLQQGIDLSMVRLVQKFPQEE
jgi:hypothetical protein